MTNRQDPTTIVKRISEIRDQYQRNDCVFRRHTVEIDQLYRGLDDLQCELYRLFELGLEKKKRSRDKKMTKQTGLFKPEIYEAMQSMLQGCSMYRGAEEAFEMFYADKKLQDFLRAYAIKEDIIESKKKEYRCPPVPRFSQAGKDRGILLIDDSKSQAHDCGAPFGVSKSGIYIGPRQNQDAALMIYTHLGDIIAHQSTGFAAGEVIKEDVWKIQVYTYFGGIRDNSFDGKSFPVSQAPLFQRIGKQDILNGLEKAINKLVNESRK